MAEAKRRHGCLTVWLMLMIVSNSLCSLVYLFASGAIGKNLPNYPAWSFPVLGIISIVNVVCAVAILKWKKWGFFGFIVTCIIVAFINLSLGINIFMVLLGLSGAAILFGVLQIGKEKKGWTQLE